MLNTRSWCSALIVAAGLMGSAGVIVAAAGAHLSGGESARVAAEFLLVHAAVVFGAGNSDRADPALLIGASVLAIACSVFSADLALASLGGLRPLPMAAPVGGTGLIAGWMMVVVAGLRRLFPGS